MKTDDEDDHEGRQTRKEDKDKPQHVKTTAKRGCIV
jgi:hypothetical protein